MLTYTFNNQDTLTNQLYHFIKEDILNSLLKPHTQLPSKRSLAKQLNISTITVENAYMQLLSEGFIYSKNRIGYFISELDLPDKHNHPIPLFHLDKNDNTYLYDLSSNRTNSDNFPFSSWAKITRKVLNNYKDQLMIPGNIQGNQILREAIRDHLRDYRDIHVSSDQIIIGSGTEYLYSLLIQLFGYDHIYGLETPGYTKIQSLYESHHIHYEQIPLDKNGLDLKQIHRATILHVTPSHHFPTGITMPIKRRYELIKWAGKKNHYIIEDDYDSEFRMNGKPLASLFSLDNNEKTIYMNTFTKSLTSTIRISYMILPPSLASSFFHKLSFYTCPVSHFDQYTLALFIKEGYFEKHINRMRNIYRHKRDFLFKCIAQSPLYKIAHIKEENAGLHFLLELDIEIDDHTLIKRAHHFNINIQSLSHYGAKTQHVFIINYSSLKEEIIPSCLEKLYQICMNNS